jgi:hypothetical protein
MSAEQQRATASESRAEQLRQQIRQAQQSAHESVDRLDPTGTISAARRMRSLIYHLSRATTSKENKS